MEPHAGSSLSSLRLSRLDAVDFRNLARITLVPGARFTVLHGANGQGKTNVLEAIAVGCSGKSFRTSRLPELLRTGTTKAILRLRINDGTEERVQDACIGSGSRQLRIDGKRPASLAAYALRSPVVTFHPGVLEISQGPGQPRRQLLDRLALHNDASLEEALLGHAKAQRSRLKLLTDRGPLARELDAYEELIVRHGMRLFDARFRICAEFLPLAEALHARLALNAEPLRLAYTPRESSPAAFMDHLAERRALDRVRGMSSVGAQRDDVDIFLGERAARTHGSQGQHRTIALALKLAEVEFTARLRHVRPLVLLDDVSSELDRARTAQLFEHLSREASQVFLTTTRADLIVTPEDLKEGDREDREERAGELLRRGS